MFAAFLTTIFFSLSVIFAARSSRLLGGTTANFARMLVALAVLGIWAHTFGQLVQGQARWYFFLSGVVGFGFGDIALFLALTRIGPRLTILLAQCLAAPFGAAIERAWLGTTLTGAQLLCGFVILLGVTIALAPTEHLQFERRALWLGTMFGIFAALGQALGAVMSRKASQIAELGGLHLDGGSAAYQRLIGGMLVTSIFFVVVKILRKRTGHESTARRWRSAWPWVVLNGLAGPAIGVGCYQWALSTTPSGIVLPIVATAPVVTIPLAFFIDGDRPGLRSVIGGIIAVAGSIALTLV